MGRYNTKAGRASGPVTLQNAQTTGDGVVQKIFGASRDSAFYIIWSPGVTAGGVQLETAQTKTYSGTWAPLGAENTFKTDATDIIQLAGPFLFVRARISTDVVGGTVTVVIVGT